jgi:polyphenol oxidase
MVNPPYQTAANLYQESVVHGFFGREGGVSSGIFTSLNCGLNKGDEEANVRQNRELICQTMGIEHMVSLRQVHRNDVLIVDATTLNGHESDAMVSNTPGLLLAIQTADCAPILLSDAHTGVIGAVHAGWRGAVQDIVDKTVIAMQSLGANIENITAAIGPCIQQSSFEVGQEVFEAANNAVFFTPANRQKHYFFDLPGYLMHQLKLTGITNPISLPFNTYALNGQYFSYRRACHAQKPSYDEQAYQQPSDRQTYNGVVCGGQMSVIGWLP